LTRHHNFEIVPAGKGVCASIFRCDNATRYSVASYNSRL
jgi:hypothetical protein